MTFLKQVLIYTFNFKHVKSLWQTPSHFRNYEPRLTANSGITKRAWNVKQRIITQDRLTTDRTLAHVGHYWLAALEYYPLHLAQPYLGNLLPTYPHRSKLQLYSVKHTIRLIDVRQHQRNGVRLTRARDSSESIGFWALTIVLNTRNHNVSETGSDCG
jgi:hypothetical protein